MADVTDRQKLEIKIRSTIEFNFGSMCDAIGNSIANGTLDQGAGLSLQRLMRKYGNDAIRVIGNHLDYVNISTNHRMTPINTERVKQRVKEG